MDIVHGILSILLWGSIIGWIVFRILNPKPIRHGMIDVQAGDFPKGSRLFLLSAHKTRTFSNLSGWADPKYKGLWLSSRRSALHDAEGSIPLHELTKLEIVTERTPSAGAAIAGAIVGDILFGALGAAAGAQANTVGRGIFMAEFRGGRKLLGITDSRVIERFQVVMLAKSMTVGPGAARA